MPDFLLPKCESGQLEFGRTLGDRIDLGSLAECHVDRYDTDRKFFANLVNIEEILEDRVSLCCCVGSES